MVSMTGFGRAELTSSELMMTVEIKSVNNKYLDINVNMPGSLSALEQPLRNLVSSRVARGRVDLAVRYRDYEEGVEVSADRSVIESYLSAIETVREVAGIADPVRLEHLIDRDGVFRSERNIDTDRYWKNLQSLAKEALDRHEEARVSEGKRLQEDITEQLERISAAWSAIESEKDQIEEQVRANLSKRFREVVGNEVEENRMLAEIAVQLTRFSIHEEIVRLKAHLESFYSTYANAGPVGKKLDFLCQEMHREINTIGSKSIVLSISEQVIEAKEALDNVREQLRNVE